MDLQSNMEVLGKRHPFLLRYKAGVDEAGVVLFVSMDIFSDSGFSFYDDTSYLAELHARVKTKSIIKLKLIISWLYFLLYYNASPTHV